MQTRESQLPKLEVPGQHGTAQQSSGAAAAANPSPKKLFITTGAVEVRLTDKNLLIFISLNSTKQ